MGKKGEEFFNWFRKHKSTAMRDCMLKPLRRKAGLGIFPKRFTTNRVESVNNLLKLETKGALPVDECIKQISELVMRQRRNIIWAFIGKGPFMLHPSYQSFKVDENVWMSWDEVSLH